MQRRQRVTNLRLQSLSFQLWALILACKYSLRSIKALFFQCRLIPSPFFHPATNTCYCACTIPAATWQRAHARTPSRPQESPPTYARSPDQEGVPKVGPQKAPSQPQAPTSAHFELYGRNLYRPYLQRKSGFEYGHARSLGPGHNTGVMHIRHLGMQLVILCVAFLPLVHACIGSAAVRQNPSSNHSLGSRFPKIRPRHPSPHNAGKAAHCPGCLFRQACFRAAVPAQPLASGQ